MINNQRVQRHHRVQAHQRVQLHLNLLEGVGSAVIAELVSTCIERAVALEQLYQASVRDLEFLGVPAQHAQVLYDGLQDFKQLDSECALIERHNIQLLFLTDDTYPVLLKNTHLPPLVLYCQGTSMPFSDKTVALVGARAGTEYGKRFINSIMPELAAAGCTIVSGGARGIDAMAHTAALAAGAPTVVVLGSGLLQPYPVEHTVLFEQVVASGGAVVSSFAMNMVPDKWHFPARNRIIAGLSRGVVIVQAAERSGAHSTAYFALEYGREVAVVPGAFDDPLAVGCHALIDHGARLVRCASDVLQMLDPGYKPVPAKTACVKKMSGSTGSTKLAQPTKLSESASTRDRIIVACKLGASLDDIAEQAVLSIEQAREQIFILQVEGVITQDFAGLFRVV